MSLVKDKPQDLPSSNALDAIDVGETPPAYLSFGQSPNPVDEPPELGEYRTYVLRTKCIGQSESERQDGEHRFGRRLEILACWREGDTPPPDADADQPGLFEEGDEPQAVGDVIGEMTGGDQ